MDAGTQGYNRVFAPEWFSKSNEEFGESHYPENQRFWFRADGRSLSWDEYINFSVGPEERTVYSTAKEQHGFDEKTFLPKAMEIRRDDYAAGPTVRLQWSKKCPHYDIVKHHGVPYLYFVRLEGKEERVVRSDGFNYWVDVRREELPGPGKDFYVQYVEKFQRGGEWIDGRGMTEEEKERKKGWTSWSFNHVALWKIV